MNLEQLAERSFEPDVQHAVNMDNGFAYHDGKCCERVYNAIKSIGK